jgi:hypothetical protein
MKALTGLMIGLMFLALAGCARPGADQLLAKGQAQSEPSSPGQISVSGSAEVLVVPDEVMLTLGVETVDKQLSVARKANDDILQRIFRIAKNLGIEEKYIQTDYINIEPRYDDYYPKMDFIGYFVRKNIVITLKDITKFEDLYAQVLEAGVNYVHGVEFRTSELRKHRDEARALAIQAAQEKAVALAGELDKKIGEPITIYEDYNRWWSGYSSWWGSAGSGMYQNVVQNTGGAPSSEGTSLAPGQISVTASVTVTFELR